MSNKFLLIMTFLYKCVEAHTSASAYRIAIQLLFSFTRKSNVLMKLRKNINYL